MMQTDSMLQERVRELFVYKDGLLYRKNSEVPAGSSRSDGRRVIGMDRKTHLAYRLIWAYHYGDLPAIIDHKDGDASNDRIENLRPATKSQNGQNRRRSKRSSSVGMIGVYFDKSRGKYASEIILNRKKTYIGRFDTPEEAHLAYLKAKRVMHEFCEI